MTTGHVATTFAGANLQGDVAAFGAASQAVAPPDENIAVSSTQLAEVVNSSLWIHSLPNGAVTGSADLSLLSASPGPGYFVTDPRIAFDSLGGRWYLSYLWVNTGAGGGSTIIVAGSAGTTPSTISPLASNWNIYGIHTSGVLDDQPRLGFSSDKILVSWNAFQPSPPASCGAGSTFCYLGAVTSVLQRSDIDGGAAVLRLVTSSPDPARFSVTAVQELTATTDAWLVYNNADVAFGINGTNPSIGVTRVTGLPSTTVTFGVEQDPGISPTTVPPSAAQPGTSAVIDTGDDRVLSATWRSGNLWITTNDGCSTHFSCGRFVELAVATGSDNATLVPGQDWDVAAAGTDFYYPAASFDSFGDMMASVSESSPSTFTSVAGLGEWFSAPGVLSFLTTITTSPSVYYDTSFPDGPCFTASVPAPCRWGDYAGAAFDPSIAGSVWVVGEDVATGAGTSNWGTFIARLTSAPVFTADTPPTTAATTVPYNYTFAADGSPASTFTVASGGLPTGLSLNPSGALTGTPTANGPFTFTVSASNGVAPNAVSPSITITVGPSVAPTFTANSPPATTALGADYSYTFTATGNPAPTFSVASGSVPPGITLNSISGVLAGNSTSVGVFTFTVSASNGVNPAVTSPSRSITVSANGTRVAVRGGDSGLWTQSGNDATAPEFNGAWTGRGGSIIGAPAVVSAPLSSGIGGTVYYIATGTDHNLWVRGETAGWQRLSPTPVNCTSSPGATVAGFGLSFRLFVACRGGDGGLWYASNTIVSDPATLPTMTGGSWHTLGGSIIDGPAIVGDDAFGGPFYYGTGTDGRVWLNDGSNWSPTGLACTGHLSAAGVRVNGQETKAFACQGPDHSIWVLVSVAGATTGSSLFSIGGSLIDGPGIALTPTSITIAAEGSDRHLWQRTAPLGTLAFGGWVPAGGSLSNGANATAVLSASSNP